MKKKVRFLNQIQYHIMLIPAVVMLFVFHYIPLYGVVIAFQKYSPATGFRSKWVGLDNFVFVFSQPNFIQTIWNTLYMAVFEILLGIVVPVSVAILLNEIQRTRYKRLFQTVIYLPHFISWVILAGVFNDILASDGIVNTLLQAIGWKSIGFLTSNSVFPWTMILLHVWKGFGYGTIIYMATLSGIDPSLYESAVIDGASRWQKMKYITVPMLVPIIVLMLILSVDGILNAGFDQVFNMYSPIVYESGDIIDTYVYRLGLVNAQFSKSSAVGLFKSVVGAILVLLSNYLADRVAGYRIL